MSLRGLLPGSLLLVLLLPAARAQGLLGMDAGVPGAAAVPTVAILGGPSGVLFQAVPSFPLEPPAPALAAGPLDDHFFVRLEGPAAFVQGTAQGVQLDPGGQLVLARGPGGYRTKGRFLSQAHRTPRAFDALQLGWQAQAPAGTGFTVYVRGVDPGAEAAAPWSQVALEGEVRYDQAYPAWQYMVILFTTRADRTPTFAAIVAHPATLAGAGDLLGQGDPGASAPPPRVRRPAPRRGRDSALPTSPRKPRPRTPTGAPEIIAREDWGAKAPTMAREPMKPELFTIHHTASPGLADYRGAATIRSIQAYHQGTHGWSDIGYHYLIGPDGKIFEGRPPDTVGAHCIPNTGKVGICLIGNFEGGDEVPEPAVASLVQLMAWLGRKYAIAPGAKLHGHRDFMQTSCPGAKLYQRLPRIHAALLDALGR